VNASIPLGMIPAFRRMLRIRWRRTAARPEAALALCRWLAAFFLRRRQNQARNSFRNPVGAFISARKAGLANASSMALCNSLHAGGTNCAKPLKGALAGPA